MPARAKAFASSGAKTWEDLRAATGLGEDLIKAGIRTGELPGYVVGTRYLIPGPAFDAFLAGTWEPKPRPIFSHAPAPVLIKTRKAS